MTKVPAKLTPKAKGKASDDARIVGLSPAGKKAASAAAAAISAATKARRSATPFKTFKDEMEDYVGKELIKYTLGVLKDVAIDYIVPQSASLGKPVGFETITKKIGNYVADEVIRDLATDYFTLIRAKSGAGKNRRSTFTPTTIHNAMNGQVNYILALRKKLGIHGDQKITQDEITDNTENASFEALDAYHEPFEDKADSTTRNEQIALTSVLTEKYGKQVKKSFSPGKYPPRVVSRVDYYDKAQFDRIDELLAPDGTLPPERTKAGKLRVNADVEAMNKSRDRLIIRIAATMGARPGGITGLNLGDVVDIGTRMVEYQDEDGKTKKRAIWDTPVDAGGMLSIAPRLPGDLILQEKGKQQLRPMWSPESIHNTFMNYFYETIAYRKKYGLPIDPDSPLFIQNRYPTGNRDTKRYAATFGKRVVGRLVNETLARIQKHEPKTFPLSQKKKPHGLSVAKRGYTYEAARRYKEQHPGEVIPDEFMKALTGHTNPETSWLYAQLADEYKKEIVGSRTMRMEPDTLAQPVAPVQIEASGEGYDTGAKPGANAAPGDPSQTLALEDEDEDDDEGALPDGVAEMGEIDTFDQTEDEDDEDSGSDYPGAKVHTGYEYLPEWAQKLVGVWGEHSMYAPDTLLLGEEDEEQPLVLGPEDEEQPLELGEDDEVVEEDDEESNLEILIRDLILLGGKFAVELGIHKLRKKLQRAVGSKTKGGGNIKPGGIKTPGNVQNFIDDIDGIGVQGKKDKRWLWKKILKYGVTTTGLAVLGGVAGGNIALQVTVDDLGERLESENIDIQSLSADQIKEHVERHMPDAGPYTRSAIAYYLSDRYNLPKEVRNSVYENSKFKRFVDSVTVLTSDDTEPEDWSYMDTAAFVAEALSGDLVALTEEYKAAEPFNNLNLPLEDTFQAPQEPPSTPGLMPEGAEESKQEELEDEALFDQQVFDEGIDEGRVMLSAGTDDAYPPIDLEATGEIREGSFSEYPPTLGPQQHLGDLRAADRPPTQLIPATMDLDTPRALSELRAKEQGGYQKPPMDEPQVKRPNEDIENFGMRHHIPQEALEAVFGDNTEKYNEKSNIGFVSEKELEPREPMMARGTPSKEYNKGFADYGKYAAGP